jgi:hypothetical protein
VVIYYYASANVASPALDPASPIIRKVAYGAATLTTMIAGVVNGHVSVEYLYVRLFRKQPRRYNVSKDPQLTACRSSYVVRYGVIAWVIAEGIPVFDDLLGITGALFVSWFTYGVYGIPWLQMNMKRTAWRIAPSGSWIWRNVPLFSSTWGTS